MLAGDSVKVLCSNTEYDKLCWDAKGHGLPARASGTASQKVPQLSREDGRIGLKMSAIQSVR
jgi:hypothetical protein